MIHHRSPSRLLGVLALLLTGLPLQTRLWSQTPTNSAAVASPTPSSASSPAASASPAVVATATPAPTPTPVPTPAPDAKKDALGQPFCNLYPDKIRPAEYDKWQTFVLSRTPEEQAWLRTAEKSLGGAYAPNFIKGCGSATNYDPVTDCFGYVKDDPKLPRMLIIGNSISRGYTVPTRLALKGVANVHRAPANCGRTDYFFKDADANWLTQNGSDKWDIVTVGYGIHDAGKSPQAYTENLKKIITRLRQTGATIVLVNATPWYNKEDTARTNDHSPGVNATLAAFAKEEGLMVVNHHDLVLPRIAELQSKDGTHFNDEGYKILGEGLAAEIKPLCKPKH